MFKRVGTICLVYLLTTWLVYGSFAVAATLPSGFQETTVVSGLNVPVGLEFLPDSRMLVIEQPGKIRLVVNNVLQTNPILDITSEILYLENQGLLGIAIDQDYPTRPYIYLYYTNQTPNLQYVVRYTLTGTLDDPLSTNLIVDTSSRVYLLSDIPNDQKGHNGGTLRFGPDKTLFISVGDDGWPNGDPCVAQYPTYLKGVIIRILVDDSVLIDPITRVANKSSLVPSDNPWASSTDENERLVWAFGLRNPFRFTADHKTGRLFIADVGEHTREEIDMSVGGENFGWPYWEGTVPGLDQSCGGADGTMPIYDVGHNPAESPVCGPVYWQPTGFTTNLSFPIAYEGMVFFTDFFEGFLRALKETNTGSWELVSPMNLPNGDFGSGLAAPSDLIMGPDGALYYTAYVNNEVRKIGYNNHITIDNVWTSDLADNPKSDFFPGEPIRYNLDYTFTGNPLKKYKVIAVGKSRDRSGTPWQTPLPRQVINNFPGSYSTFWDEVVSGSADSGSRGMVILRAIFKDNAIKIDKEKGIAIFKIN